MDATHTQIKPLVIKRGDDYVIINIPDIGTLSSAQRVGIGLLAWQQMKHLLDINGVNTSDPRTVDRFVGEAMQTGPSGVTLSRYGMNRQGEEHFESLIAGEISLTEFHRRSGMEKGKRKISTSAISTAKDGRLYFGKGDRFEDAVIPIHRYLAAWKKRGFAFTHLPPKEAGRRLRWVRNLIADLQAVERDLEGRSQLATLRAPHERKENGN